MGVESSYNAIQLYDLDLPHGTKISTEELERWYHKTGEHPEGPVEMRQSWSFSLLVPRTYYANGATTQRHSKHTQPIFNSLLDFFPNTHRRKRFDLRRLPLQPQQTAVVYDYTSFTSLMEEQYYFLNALANFLRGHHVWIVDTFVGPIKVDLGDLIDDYVLYCNDRPEFVLSEPLKEILGMFSDLTLYHECAGMLGVNSNLASCTALHGINLSFITGSVDSNSCVGDDAIGIINLYASGLEVEEGEYGTTREQALRALQVVGRVAPEKTRFMLPTYEEPIHDSCRWTYLKRWLERYDQELLLGSFINFPPYVFLQRHLETERRMTWDFNNDAELIPRLCAQIFGCVRGLADMRYEDMDRGQYTLAYEYLAEFYRLYRLPMDGWIFAEKGIERNLSVKLKDVACIPAIGRSPEEFAEIIMQDPVKYLLRNILLRSEAEYFEVPKCVEGSWSEGLFTNSIVSTVTSGLSLARKLGYAEKSSVRERCCSDIFVDSFRKFLDVKTQVVYEWTLSPMPSWLYDILIV
jgi:hypothetical protein